ncbi:MAG: FAD-binding oxidoreductase [Acidobacteriota bacterium]
MKTRHGVSYWLDRFPKSRLPAYPRHRGDLTTQVAILGGGLTGCAAAYVFAAAGLRVALLEAGRIAHGGTAFSPGFLRLEPAVSFRSLEQRHGLRAARHIWQTFRRAGLDFGATIRRLRIRGELVTDAAFRLGLDAADQDALGREMKALRGAGVDGAWLTPARVRLETGLDTIGGIRSAGDGYIDPYRVAIGLAAAAAGRKAAIFERTPVTKVRSRARGVELVVEGGVVKAEAIIVATDHPEAPFTPLRRHFKEMDSYCVLTAPVPSFVRRGFGRSRATVIDQDEPRHALRRTSDERVLFVGADQPRVAPRLREKVLAQRTGQLMYELSKLYPAISGIQPEYGWDVPVSITTDGFLCAGPHRNYPHHLFAMGAGHNGSAAPYLAARVLLRHFLGQAEKGDELFGFPRILG